MDKVKNASVNTGNENLDKLRHIFPQFVKENKIDLDALKKFFHDEEMVAGEEKYGLNWAGKSNAFKLIRTPSVGTLTPREKESKDWDKTENLFIEGDNLEVLKLLQKHYREKIKMIYIDPPYNTGKDFIYKDNYTENISDYYEKTGQSKNGIKMTTNPESAGRYHSDWLTMMYPRLFLARNLLKEDGVIFISIDDNEIANLRLIMDEIFGEENLVGTFTVIRAEGGGLAEQYVKGHDYLFAYAKNIDKFEPLRRPKEIRGKIIVKDGKKYWIETDWLRKEFGKYGTLPYEQIEEIKGKGKKEEIDEGLKSGSYELIKIKSGQHIVGRLRLIEEDGSKFYSILKHLSADGNSDLDLLGMKDCFDFPKPVSLLKTIIFGATFFTKNNKDLILDFFAGSGTTAQAVMELNANDGGNRKYICVQLPEELDENNGKTKEAKEQIRKTITFLKKINKPTNIAEICKERIRRAGENIKKGEIKFKSIALSKSNYRQWNLLTDRDDEQKLKKQMKLFLEKPLVDGYDEESVVYEILLKEGYNLNSKVTQEKNGNMKYWQVVDEDKKLLVTFEKEITKDQVEFLKLSEEDTFVCLDSALDDTIKINIGRNLNVKVI